MTARVDDGRLVYTILINRIVALEERVKKLEEEKKNKNQKKRIQPMVSYKEKVRTLKGTVVQNTP